MSRSFWVALVAIVLSAVAVITLVPRSAPATGIPTAPDRWWPTYGGSFANTRHAELDRIGPANVASLKLAWSFATGISGQIETSPVAVDGMLYATTGPDNGVFALDAGTGALKWHFVPKVGKAAYLFAVNRGVAVAGGRVYFTTLDNQLIALDAHTGKLVWTTRIGDPRTGLSESAAPLAWDGLVFVGSSGGEMGVRGSYSAYAQKDGHFVWRWWTVSRGWEGKFAPAVRGIALHRNIAREKATLAKYADAWQHGGGSIWMTPALSPEESTIYLSTGNPSPSFNGERRPGDNLYTDSIVALDAHSGKIKWYYQETPHDVWDYDASSPPVLFDARDASGQLVKAVGEAGKTGWLYVLNRVTGKLIRVAAFVPQPNVYHPLSAKGEPIQPGDGGGALAPIAYDPALRAAFVAGNVLPEIGQTFVPPAWTAGATEWKGGNMQETAAHETSLLSRIDTDTGRVRWSAPIHNLLFGGPLSTNGLVFVGEETAGTFRAFAAADGKELWHVSPGDELRANPGVREFMLHLLTRVNHVRHPDWTADGDIHAPAIAYRMNGREYIVVASNVFASKAHAGGDTIFAFALP